MTGIFRGFSKTPPYHTYIPIHIPPPPSHRLLFTNPLFRAMGGYGSGHGDGGGVPIPMQKVNIGKREIVWYGTAGEANYMDNIMHPFPAIR